MIKSVQRFKSRERFAKKLAKKARDSVEEKRLVKKARAPE
jgi:hypothetical protein